MKMIQANCRAQFTAHDVEFVVDTLGHGSRASGFLVDLLADPEARDLILDDDALHRTLLERGGCLRVSAQLYFYVLVRRELRAAGLDDRMVADYVAEMLAEFSQAAAVPCRSPGVGAPLDYAFEVMAALETADADTAFRVRAHLGNHALFMTGVFPDRIRHRTARRGAPGLRYYEELGRASFRLARDHRLARAYEVDGIFDTLADRFATARGALNELRERVINLGEPDWPVAGN